MILYFFSIFLFDNVEMLEREIWGWIIMLYSKVMLLEDRKIKYWFEILIYLKNIKNVRFCFDILYCVKRENKYCVLWKEDCGFFNKNIYFFG